MGTGTDKKHPITFNFVLRRANNEVHWKIKNEQHTKIPDNTYNKYLVIVNTALHGVLISWALTSLSFEILL